ncbi:3-dehydroquinate synthase [Flexivirga endophytica]|uniref:3-dehydroquinate synthase n=1 Tax=Flexivirga endophytica TaxID=1849103 RepID=A0A916T5Z2_9MICO|nr:3-dehydroquinate synthase [Flexivirga endophytica]GGB32963.1 3-dehydroquinate synthase [Flexivirga endophytica]GHB40955.1 3-dehydroquinate synthase [Flexivirga endophytica]
MSDTKVIRVGDDYDVIIGNGVLDQVVPGVPAGAQRVLIVHAPVMADAAATIAGAATAAGLEPFVEELPDAEAAKTVDVATRLWSVLAEAGFTRTDAVIALGGGATTDLGGFVAATWLRGVPVVQVPSTVLGMVDAAVGGKTGINIPEGKNLVGSFHPPAAVICDLDLLRTLPRDDLVAGLGEVVKCGFIADPRILELAADPVAATDVSGAVLPELVARAVQVKADVVSTDLREAGLREILNYGHTFAHAVEQVSGFSWRHGDAVAVGMVYVAEVARRAGLIDDALVDRHRKALQLLGLPTSYPVDGDVDERWTALRVAMGRDKKTRGSTLRFVALTEVAAPTRLSGPDETMLREAFDAVRS